MKVLRKQSCGTEIMLGGTSEMKGVILCGGYGTRLRPCTEVTNKHLLPIFNRPMVCSPLQTLKDIGITNICAVLGGENIDAFMRFLQDGEQFGLKLSYVYQRKAGGIAEAVGLCEDFVGDDDFIVILGDNLFLGSLQGFKEGFENTTAVCGLMLAKAEHPKNYGVPRFERDKIVEIVEKPEFPPSNYAVTGVYAYTSEVFDEIRKLKPSARGELEISDVHTNIIKGGGEVYWEIYQGTWFDCGESFNNLLYASIAVKKHREENARNDISDTDKE